MDDKETEINLYVNIKKPLRFQPCNKFTYEFADRVSALECIVLDMVKKIGISYDAENPKAVIASHYKPIEQKLRINGEKAYNDLKDEYQQAEKESRCLFKEYIIATDEFTGLIMDWKERHGTKTLEEIVIPELSIFDLKAVRQKQVFIDDLIARFDNRLLDFKLDNKPFRIKFRLRFPPPKT